MLLNGATLQEIILSSLIYRFSKYFIKVIINQIIYSKKLGAGL
jgi:hypothetical protein